jgi:hypothetical protein
MKRRILEAKGAKPGDRMFKASQAAGPATGPSASPVGKDNFNPEVYRAKSDGTVDKGLHDEMSIYGVLMDSLRIIKKANKSEEFLKIFEPHIEALTSIKDSKRTINRLLGARRPSASTTLAIQDHKENIIERKSQLAQSFKSDSLIDRILSFIKSCARGVIAELSPQEQKALKSFSEIGANPSLSPSEMKFINNYILTPGGLRELKSVYVVQMQKLAQDTELKEPGIINDPFFSLMTFSKTAFTTADRAMKPQIADSHVMRNAARGRMTPAESELLKTIKRFDNEIEGNSSAIVNAINKAYADGSNEAKKQKLISAAETATQEADLIKILYNENYSTFTNLFESLRAQYKIR